MAEQAGGDKPPLRPSVRSPAAVREPIVRSIPPDVREGGHSSGSLAKASLPHPMDTIAELELLEVAPSGRRSPVRVQVGRPRCCGSDVASGEWILRCSRS